VDVSVDPGAAVIGLLALGVAGFFSWRQAQLQRRVTAIEEARHAEELESRQRAEVTAVFRIRQEPNHEQHYVFILNRGPAQARDINVTLDHSGPGQMIVTLDSNALPIPRLDRLQEYPIQVIFELHASKLIDVVISWVDGHGQHRKTLRSSWY
jgi:hypothetical protein